MQKRNTGDAATGGGTEKSMGGGGGGGTAKKRRTMATRKDDEDMSNVFTVELDTLHCEICFLPFESSVYTCKNGHAACGKCCVSVGRKCCFCGEPIGDSRCRAMEKIIAGMTRPCKFSKNGCPETVRFTETGRHEEECRYAPYGCPFDGCGFVGMDLYGHIVQHHAMAASTMDRLWKMDVRLDKDEPFRALLQHHRKIVYLLLNGGDVLRGRSLSLVRVYPKPYPGMQKELSTITVLSDAKPGSLSLYGNGYMDVKFARQQQGLKTKSSLLDTDSFTVEVRISIDCHSSDA